MMCEICHGTGIVSRPLGNYGLTVDPCPNCTDYRHKNYECELESVIKDDQQERITQGTNSR